MDHHFRTWKELSTNELYGLLQLRSEVFVVEQQCIYSDVDGIDDQAVHLIYPSKEGLVPKAYCRLFLPNSSRAEAKIGRVVVSDKHRSEGLGRKLMKTAVKYIQNQGIESIRLEAQTYLVNFYASLGFQVDGAEYLEDGIPHISMSLRF
jgi:ElaA protein